MTGAERIAEVFLDFRGKVVPIGRMRCLPARGRERVVFEYAPDWLSSLDRFAIDQGLPLTAGAHAPSGDAEMFPVLGDSAPDTWGRSLMRRKEGRLARREGRPPRTLFEADYVLGVADVSRIGALRVRWQGQQEFQAPVQDGVPGYVALGRLMDSARRIDAGQDRDDDIDIVFAPGASLGGARPKCSVHDVKGQLSIAKFPKQDDDYSKERWEAIAATLAAQAGIDMAPYRLEAVRGRPVFLTARFDRTPEGGRIPYMSAMTMTQSRDGVGGSYLEIVDALVSHGSRAEQDKRELFRRLVFSVLISNTDDHLRNHGFLWDGRSGWHLSPAFDINPTSTLEKPRVLTTLIDFDDGTCDLDLVLSVAEEFGLSRKEAGTIVGEVAAATSGWHEVAQRHDTPAQEIAYMETAFEHADLERARRFTLAPT